MLTLTSCPNKVKLSFQSKLREYVFKENAIKTKTKIEIERFLYFLIFNIF